MFLLSIICSDCKNTAFVTWKLNSFWLIREGSNMQKTVFLQSLRIIFEKKIHFWGITECSKHYFCISCIDHFKTNVALIHHNIHEILLLPSLYLSSQNIIRENQVVHRSRQGIWYSIIEIFSILDIYSHNFNYSGALENKQQAGGVFGLTPRNQGYWRSSIFCQFIYFLSFL